MFPFKKPPSRAEVAQQTVANAIESLSHHAHDWLESAGDLIEGTLESASEKVGGASDKLERGGEKVGNEAQDAVELSPLEKAKVATGAAGASVAGAAGAASVAATGKVAEAAEKLGALKAVAGAAVAGKSLSEKVGEGLAAIGTSSEGAKESVRVPDVKRARKQAQSEIKNMNKEAAKYQRELEKELARDQKLFDAEQERLEREHAQLQAQLDAARREAELEIAELDSKVSKKAKRRAKRDAENDIVRVPVAPLDGVIIDSDGDGTPEYSDPDYNDDYDTDYDDDGFRYDEEKQGGGGNGWLIFGGLLLAGAGAVYYLFSSTDGSRKRAQIQDRVGQVAAGVREKVTQSSDEAGEPMSDGEVEEVTEAAADLNDRSNERLPEEEIVITGTIDAKLPPTSKDALPDKAGDKIGEVSDKLAEGIAGAGAFLADKLEAAGAGAKSAAHSAAEKMDDVKEKAVAKMDDAKVGDAKKPVILKDAAAPTGAVGSPQSPSGAVPDVIVGEIITEELPQGETTEEILAEVEQTVQNIENSVREEKR